MEAPPPGDGGHLNPVQGHRRSVFRGVKDTKADFNSNRAKLSMGSHPNKRLAALWEQYGEEGFEWSVLKILDYENPEDDHTAELEKLREQCLAEDEKAVKIWK